MKVFVSGAAGFLGRAVSSELARRGHKVVGLVRTDAEGASIEQPGLSYVTGDLFVGGKWCDAIKDVDKVISLTNPSETGEVIPRDKVDIYSDRHREAVSNLIQAASAGRAKTVVVTYHTDCYGNRHGKWSSEADAMDPIGHCRPIAGALDVVEKLAEELELNLIRVYPSMVYGNGGWFKRLVNDFRNGKARVVEPGDNYLNLIHIDDLAGLYAEIVEKIDKSEVFTLTDNRPVTQRELMEHISTLMGLPRPKTVDFTTYSREYGWLEAEAMSASTRVPGNKAIDALGYSMKVRSYEKGIAITLTEMGLDVGGKFLKVA